MTAGGLYMFPLCVTFAPWNNLTQRSSGQYGRISQLLRVLSMAFDKRWVPLGLRAIPVIVSSWPSRVMITSSLRKSQTYLYYIKNEFALAYGCLHVHPRPAPPAASPARLQGGGRWKIKIKLEEPSNIIIKLDKNVMLCRDVRPEWCCRVPHKKLGLRHPRNKPLWLGIRDPSYPQVFSFLCPKAVKRGKSGIWAERMIRGETR